MFFVAKFVHYKNILTFVKTKIMNVLNKNLEITTSVKLTLPLTKLIKVDELIECYGISKSIKNSSLKKNIGIDYVIDTKLKGVYFLLDDNEDIIYIGKSSNCIRSRLLNHLASKPSVYSSKDESLKIDLKRKLTKYISFIELDEKGLDIVEILLIDKFKPKLNTQYKF